MAQLIQIIAFDAIVGNNDRHFYNWGFIGNVLNKANKRVSFAPAYDTARGLLWSFTEKKVQGMYSAVQHGDDLRIISFISKSKPRFSIEGNSKANHFDLVESLGDMNPAYRRVISDMVTEEHQKLAL